MNQFCCAWRMPSNKPRAPVECRVFCPPPRCRMSLHSDSPANDSVQTTIAELCHLCGLCCDGTLFVKVPLRAPDSPEHLGALGPRIGHDNGDAWLNLPCAAHRDLSCAIHAQRPAQCRAFECKLLQELILDQRSLDSAHRIIERTRQQADSVRILLRQRVHDDETLPLSRRYLRYLAQKGTDSNPDGELMLAVLKLTQLLQLSFYIPE